MLWSGLVVVMVAVLAVVAMATLARKVRESRTVNISHVDRSRSAVLPAVVVADVSVGSAVGAAPTPYTRWRAGLESSN
jgi:hypothetical protein